MTIKQGYMRQAIQLLKTSHRHIQASTLIGVVVMLMLSTVWPAEIRWSNAEAFIASALPLLCLLEVVTLLLRKNADIKISLLDVLFAAWMLYCFFRSWIGAEYPCATQLLMDSVAFILYFALRGLPHSGKTNCTLIATAIVLCGFYEALYGFYQMTMGESRHPYFALTGSFLNPGPYSAYLLVALIAGIMSKGDVTLLIKELPTKCHPYVTGLYNTILAILGIMLLSTWSRAAILTFTLFCLWHYRKHYWRWRLVAWVVCAGVIVGLYFIKQDSANGRILTWTASLCTWLHTPWLGVGIGGFRHACAQGISELYAANHNNLLFISGNVSEYAFCDILKVLVEQGIIGFAICTTTMLAVLYNVFSASKPLFWTLLALVAFSMFSYPFELYPYRVLLIIVAALTPHRPRLEKSCSMRGKVAIVLCGLLMAGASALIAKEIQARRNADKESALLASTSDEAFIPDYYRLLQRENDNPQFLFQFAKALREAGRYNESNAMLSNGALVSNDHMFYVLQGNNYKDMGLPHIAEQTYLKAYSVMPNRLYPLYKLMVLYGSMGQKLEMRQMARRIIQANPKITSPATKEMKHKAQEAL